MNSFEAIEQAFKGIPSVNCEQKIVRQWGHFPDGGRGKETILIIHVNNTKITLDKHCWRVDEGE